MPRSLRSDATINRQRMLDSTRDLLAARGTRLSMRQVAERAGVGPATLYRHFPTKQHLLDGVLADELRRCLDIVRAGAAEDDPLRGLRRITTDLTVLGARNRPYLATLLSLNTRPDLVPGHHTAMSGLLAELTARATRTGRVRSDLSVADVRLMLLAGRGLDFGAVGNRTAAAARFAVLAVDGFVRRS